MSVRVTGFLNEGTYLERIGFLYEAQVRFLIEGAFSGDRRIAQAQAMQAPGLPVSGEPYPASLPPPPGSDGVPFTCRSLRVQTNDGANWVADARYAQGGGGSEREPKDEDLIAQTVIEVGAEVTEVETNIDADGEILTVDYTNPQGVTKTQAGLVRVPRSNTLLRFRRRETRDPSEKGDLYGGAVNRDSVGRYAPRTLLCRRIYGTSDDSGLSYDVEYVFARKVDKHTFAAVYRDVRTGQPPADVRIGNGIVLFDNLVPALSFSDLLLPWPK